jgi:hypothetical protein
MSTNTNKNNIEVSYQAYTDLTLRLDTKAQEKYDNDETFRKEVSHHVKAYWIAKMNLSKLGITDINIVEL